MTDVMTREQRSRAMRAIRSGNTRPEMFVRRYLHACGLRFRLHVRELPGTPDIVLPRYRTVVFVNGCFWHRHPGCRFATSPSSRREFWEAKFAANVKRDETVRSRLESMGWGVLVVWECESRNPDALDLLFWKVVTGNLRSSAVTT